MVVPNAPQTGALLKPRILLVDDHAVLRRGVESVLKLHSLGTVCGEAGDGDEAVRKVRELEPDLIIMDVAMPRMNGVDATREIRKFAPDVKIIILTAHNSRQMLEAVKQAGADQLIEKTEAAEQLVQTLHELYDGR